MSWSCIQIIIKMVNLSTATDRPMKNMEKSHIDPKICVFVTDLFLWFIMVHLVISVVISVSLDWFGGLAHHFSSEIRKNPRLSGSHWFRSPCLDTPHARPRAVLDFTKTYGTFLSSQTKGLSFTKVDTWFQVGCFFVVLVGGWSWHGLANPRNPSP